MSARVACSVVALTLGLCGFAQLAAVTQESKPSRVGEGEPVATKGGETDEISTAKMRQELAKLPDLGGLSDDALKSLVKAYLYQCSQLLTIMEQSHKEAVIADQLMFSLFRLRDQQPAGKAFKLNPIADRASDLAKQKMEANHELITMLEQANDKVDRIRAELKRRHPNKAE